MRGEGVEKEEEEVKVRWLSLWRIRTFRACNAHKGVLHRGVLHCL